MNSTPFRRGRSRISTVGMTRRDTVKSMLFVGGALAFHGFGRPSQAVAQGSTRIKQWYHQYGEAGTEDAVKKYASQFTEKNPDIEVEVNWQLGDYGSILSAALLTEEGPDVFEQGGPNLEQVRQKQIVPLDDLYEGVKDDFNPVNLKGATIDGKVYNVKMVDDTGAFYYRKSAFESAGVEVPQTLQQLIDVATELNSGRQKGLYLGQDGGIAAGNGTVLWSAKGNYLNEDMSAPAFNTPEVQAAWSKYGELYNSDVILQGATTDWWDPSSFIQQLCQIQWGGLWAYPAIKEAVGDDLGVFPWPKADDNGAFSTFWGGWGECVNGKSKNIEAAKKLVKFLWIDSADIQTDWNLGYGFHVPPRKSIADKATQLQESPAKEIVGYLNDYGHPGQPLWTASMGTAYTDAFTAALRDKKDPAAELKKAEDTVKKELDRLLKG